jgi:cell division protein ZapA
MAQVTLRINGYSYTVGCQDGEEPHLLAMAGDVERRIEGIKAASGPSGEARMLLMAALLMADDIYEKDRALASRRGNGPANSPGNGAAAPAPPDPKLGRRLGKLAKRAEDIAADLEQP